MTYEQIMFRNLLIVELSVSPGMSNRASYAYNSAICSAISTTSTTQRITKMWNRVKSWLSRSSGDQVLVHLLRTFHYNLEKSGDKRLLVSLTCYNWVHWYPHPPTWVFPHLPSINNSSGDVITYLIILAGSCILIDIHCVGCCVRPMQG